MFLFDPRGESEALHFVLFRRFCPLPSLLSPSKKKNSVTLFRLVADWRWGFLMPGRDDPLGETEALAVQQGIRTFQAALSRLRDRDALPPSGLSVSDLCNDVLENVSNPPAPLT